ncbi:coadhesin-like [Ruditapes philippinarum]|uniref:coadhesin-like n=1 Tax=Ruditapes philippinarum TaxID=129788 RepID=UPI00295BBB28|nr:coadhesin-like [Ruditapes philippinarum]
MMHGIIIYSCFLHFLLQITQSIALRCQDDKSMDCARLDKMFDICEDVHDAKLICPKFCNLCLLVDGNWADWSGWSECDVTCGNGKHTRFRTCTNPAPAYQGLECEGEKTDVKTCQRQSCPVHGGWSVWSKWNACPVTCGLGMQKRYRNCSDPYPLRNGNHCFGDADEYRICFQQFCEDGVWTKWGKWGACSASCGSGVRQRSRSCTNSIGTKCKGESFEVQPCNELDCPCESHPTLQNGALKRLSESQFNITYSIECNKGYESLGLQYVTCDKDSGWKKIPTCNKVSCGNPVAPSNGKLAFTTGVTFQAIAMFECYSSFTAFGNPVSTCLSDGTWSSSIRCLIPFCRSLPTLQNGVLKRLSESPFNITYNIECNKGYESSGLKLVTCNKNSGWTEIPSCNKVSCGNPVAPSNGKLAFISGVTFQAFAIFECCDTCRTSGNYVSTCLDDGTWSSSLKCIAPVSKCTKKPTYNETFKNVAFGKKVTLSSTYSSTYNAPKMVDGNFDRNNIAITQYQKDPFAVVDLEHSYTIHSIYIYNRKDYGRFTFILFYNLQF